MRWLLTILVVLLAGGRRLFAQADEIQVYDGGLLTLKLILARDLARIWRR